MRKELGYESLTYDYLTLDDLIKLLLETGDISVKIMDILDTANNIYIISSPTPRKVNVNNIKGPFIIISGHDLKDLEMLLKQTEEKGFFMLMHLIAA